MVKPKYSVLLVTFLFLIMLVVRASANGGDFVVSEKIVSIGTKCSDTEFEEAGIFLDGNGQNVRHCIIKSNFSLNGLYVINSYFEVYDGIDDCKNGGEIVGSFNDFSGNIINLCVDRKKGDSQGIKEKLLSDVKIASNCPNGYVRSGARIQVSNGSIIHCQKTEKIIEGETGESSLKKCKDSDNGKDIYNKGTIKKDKLVYTDKCLSSSRVGEYYCSNKDDIEFSTVRCPENYLCANGSCVKSLGDERSTNGCVDSDSDFADFQTFEIFLGGQVSMGKDTFVKDKCLANNVLKEAYCDEEGNIKSEEVYCGTNVCKKDFQGNGYCAPKFPCVDEDGAYNPGIKGSIKKGNTFYLDYCASNKDLVEYYCSYGGIRKEYVDCTKPEGNGCFDGACTKEIPSKCTDSDSSSRGLDEEEKFISGFVTKDKNVQEDVCINKKTIEETYCDENGELKISSQDCGEEYICQSSYKGGASCVKPCMELFPGKNDISADRVNVIFVGYGYNNIDEIIFRANEQTNGLLELKPFSEYKDKFNFWVVGEMGDIQECEEKDMIPFIHASKYLKCPTDLANNCPVSNKYVNVLIDDVNHRMSYRSRSLYFQGDTSLMIYESSMIYSKDKLLAHEFGHSFGALHDEYVEATFPFFQFVNNPLLLNGPNCYSTFGPTSQNQCFRNVAWKDMLGDGCGKEGVIDCGENVPRKIYEVGCYEGCFYFAKGAYRPTKCGIMSQRFYEGCPPEDLLEYGKVNEKVLEDKILEYSGN